MPRTIIRVLVVLAFVTSPTMAAGILFIDLGEDYLLTRTHIRELAEAEPTCIELCAIEDRLVKDMPLAMLTRQLKRIPNAQLPKNLASPMGTRDSISVPTLSGVKCEHQHYQLGTSGVITLVVINDAQVIDGHLKLFTDETFQPLTEDSHFAARLAWEKTKLPKLQEDLRQAKLLPEPAEQVR